MSGGSPLAVTTTLQRAPVSLTEQATANKMAIPPYTGAHSP